MLPRLAARVWSTTKYNARSSRPTSPSTSRVKGTKVMRDTSLVMSMEVKKGRSTSTREINRIRRLPASSFWASTAKRPQSWSPATTAIRQNSSANTRKSMYPR